MPPAIGTQVYEAHHNPVQARGLAFTQVELETMRPTAFALLSSSLQLPEVFRPSLSDLRPTLPSKLHGGGIILLRQNSEGLALFSSRYYA